MLQRKAAKLAFALAIALLPAGAFAQGQTGSIAGVVRDTTGAVLPGVTVEAASPALIEKVRSGVTDGQGAYRIPDLRPGTYSVTFTLTGFSTVRRSCSRLTTPSCSVIGGMKDRNSWIYTPARPFTIKRHFSWLHPNNTSSGIL